MAIRLFAALAAATIALVLMAPQETDAGSASTPPDGRLHGSLALKRPPVPEAPELLLIQVRKEDARAVSGPLELADLVLTLKEMDADKVLDLLPAVNITGSGVLSPERRRGLESRFEKEFSLIDKNIATLFEAIRLGSIRTKDSSRFVQELQALVQLSKSRLLAETVEGDNTGMLLLGQARATFGAGHYAGDPAALGLALPLYPDAFAVIERPVAVEGSVPFRRVDLWVVERYTALDKALYGLLVTMEHAGYLASLDPGAHPPALYEHALSLRQNLLAKPGDAAARTWREAREQYVRSVRTLLSGKAESGLLAGFDSLLAAETLEESSAISIKNLRQAVVAAFAAARSAFNEFQTVRDRLQADLRGAFCIVGAVSGPQLAAAEQTPAEATAFLANSVLSGSHFRVATGPRYRFWMLLPAVLASVLLAPFGTLVSGLLGVAAIASSAGMFSLLFVYKGIWVDPLIVAGITAAAAAASIATELAVRARIGSILRRRLGNRLPESALTVLTSRHILPPAGDLTARSAILAVRHFGEASHADQEDSAHHAAALRAFHDAAAAEITRRGGVVLGVDEFILTAGFGTPLHALTDGPANGSGMDPADAAKRACSAALDIAALAPEQSGGWRFGLDLGECNFFYSSVDGYSAVGRTVNYARLLSGLGSKYNSRILVTQGIAAAMGPGFRTRRLDSLVEKASGHEHAFYELISREQP